MVFRTKGTYWALLITLFAFMLFADPAWAQTLNITKTATPDPVVIGQTLTYNITVNNAGPGAANNVVLTDNLLTGTNFLSVTSPTGTMCIAPSSGTPGPTTVACNLNSINPGVSVPVTIQVQPTKTGPISNTASVACTPVCTSSPTTQKTTVLPNLNITKEANPNPVGVGRLLTYTLTVENQGTGDANDVVIRDQLPAGVTFVNASTGCTLIGTEVRCDVGALLADKFTTVTIQVRPTTTGTITNTAKVRAEKN
jgi:uncharacterized repeat protein (TIGR01451 family)